MNSSEPVIFEMLDSIGVICLNDPPANELAIPDFITLTQLKRWLETPGLKGLIIKGEGKNFSAGGNLDAVFKNSNHPETLKTLMHDGVKLLNYIQDLDIPVIAAINRICFGGGLEIALACHIRVASENALLAFPESNHNLMPGMGGTFRLPVCTGFARSAKMILGGDTVNAADAKEMGIVDFIAPKDQAFEYALTLMRKMTLDRPVKVIRSIMQALKNASDLPQEEAMGEETRLFCSLAVDEAERRKTEEA
ncbi:MAG: enoyl-CoA hydratase/isomerase family protein [Bacteroidales bacterium]|nr:enoyl-CoA hydratase/isomerase family protein [Bacteroidales bacterium]